MGDIERAYRKKTYLPEKGVVVSTILNIFHFTFPHSPDCETMIFRATDSEHITDFSELYAERHSPNDDLDAEHERIVAEVLSGEIEL